MLRTFRYLMFGLGVILPWFTLAAADRKEVVANAKAATALVDLETLGSGTAFCIDASGLFVTNYHVVDQKRPGDTVKLILNPAQSTEKKLTARVLKFDPENDLALLQVEGEESFATVALGDDSGVSETDDVSVFGYPFGRMLASERTEYPSISVNLGRVSALRLQNQKLRLIQIDAAINPGNSGGPVLDAEGVVIGVVVSGIRGSNVSFAIPCSVLKEFLTTPAVIAHNPKLSFHELQSPIPFEFEIISFTGSTRLTSAELFVDCAGLRSGPFTQKDPQEKIRIEANVSRPQVPGSETRKKLSLFLTRGKQIEEHRIADQSLKLDAHDIRLSEIRRIDRRNDRWLVTFNSQQKRIGQLTGWEPVGDKESPIDWKSASRIDLYSINPQPKEVHYTLKLRGENGSLPALEGIIPVKGVPVPLKDRGTIDDPFSGNVDRLHLKVQVEGADKIIVGRRGLKIEHLEQAKPGIKDSDGRYILVNGRRWYPEWEYSSDDDDEPAESDRYPLKIAGAVWHLETLKISSPSDNRHNPNRGKVTQVIENLEFIIDIKDTESGPGLYELFLTRTSFEPVTEAQPIGPSVGGRWNFDNFSDNVLKDVSGNEHHGTFVDAVRFPTGAVGKGFQVTGGASLEVAPLGIEGYEGPFSYSFWVRTDVETNEDTAPFSTVVKTGDSRGFECMLSKRRILVNLIHKWPGNGLRFHSLETITLGEWNHVTVTYDGNKTSAGVAIYINGQPATIRVTHDSLTGTFHNNLPIRFGGRVAQHMFHGIIDEVRLYKRELTAGEAGSLAATEQKQLASLEKELIAHWSFDNVTETHLPEVTGKIPSVDWTTLPYSAVIDDDPLRGKVMHVNIQGRIDCGPIGNFERNQPFTIGAWIHSGERGVKAWRMALASRMERAPRSRGYRLIMGVGALVKLHLVHDTSANNLIEVTSQDPLPINQWHYVVATYDGSSKAAGVKLYVNGTEIPMKVLTDKLSGTIRIDKHLFIGHCPSLDGSCDGVLDDVFVVDRCLTPDEVRELAGTKQPTAPPTE